MLTNDIFLNSQEAALDADCGSVGILLYSEPDLPKTCWDKSRRFECYPHEVNISSNLNNSQLGLP